MLLVWSPIPALIGAVKGLALSPLISGPLLLAVAFAPEAVRDGAASVASKLPSNLPLPTPTAELSTAKFILQILFVVGFIRYLNAALNGIAINSWRFSKGSGWDWPSEVAVVTGGSSGIGKDMVKELVKLGVQVAVLDVQELPEDLQSIDLVHFYQCDVTSTASIASAADALRKQIGHPTILINNAGVTQPTPILQLPESFLRKIMGVNLMSLWFTTQQFLPHMVEIDKGQVITIASMASFVALPNGADYAATKAGALAFHEALTAEIKHFYKCNNILTTVVHPNFVSTPLLKDVEEKLKAGGVKMLKSEAVAQQIIAQVESRRGGQLFIGAPAVLSNFRGWPTWLQELVRGVLARGSDQSKNKAVKKKVKV